MTEKYAVIFEQAEGNWAAYVPDLPGCITTGKTLEETERNIAEAIQGHIRTLREFGEPVPRPPASRATPKSLLQLRRPSIAR
jgi:predicted RNase H-like HicB family nuclease